MNGTTRTTSTLSPGRLTLLGFALIFLTTAFGCHHNPGRPAPEPPRHEKRAAPPPHQAPRPEKTPAHKPGPGAPHKPFSDGRHR